MLCSTLQLIIGIEASLVWGSRDESVHPFGQVICAGNLLGEAPAFKIYFYTRGRPCTFRVPTRPRPDITLYCDYVPLLQIIKTFCFILMFI